MEITCGGTIMTQHFPEFIIQGSNKFNRNTLKIYIVFGAKGSARIGRGPTKCYCSHNQVVRKIKSRKIKFQRMNITLTIP